MQCFAEKQAKGEVPEELLETGVNPACWEIAGHMVLKRAEDYHNISQEAAWKLLEQVSLPEDRLLEVSNLCFGEGAGKVVAVKEQLSERYDAAPLASVAVSAPAS